MKWSMTPPNPLTHTNWSTTLKRYARKGCDDSLMARKRCVEKYYDNEALRQPWMDEWVQK